MNIKDLVFAAYNSVSLNAYETTGMVPIWYNIHKARIIRNLELGNTGLN
jgi:hypothetical protein